MINWLKNLSTMVKALAVLAVLLIIALAFAWHVWTSAHAAATVARLDHAQTTATVESAKDAIATQGAATANEQASEELTQSNDKEIRNAKGADAAVDPAVRDAGLASLCRRPAYKSSQRCLHLAPAH